MAIIIVLLFTLVLLTILGVMSEKRAYNNGVCKRCGNRLEHFDNDSQGGRGYMCKCGYCVWVSYPLVDRRAENG